MSAMVLPILQSAEATKEQDRFTFQDRMDFARCQYGGAIRRMVIDDGDPTAGPSGAAFALVYLHGDPWARWGITRSGNHVITWCCRTGADISATEDLDAESLGVRIAPVPGRTATFGLGHVENSLWSGGPPGVFRSGWPTMGDQPAEMPVMAMVE